MSGLEELIEEGQMIKAIAIEITGESGPSGITSGVAILELLRKLNGDGPIEAAMIDMANRNAFRPGILSKPKEDE